MNDVDRAKHWYNRVAATYSREQRQNWYSEVAMAYDQVRPRYAPALIEGAIAAAQLPAAATILELGCGPGIATLPLAERGLAVVGLEPSSAACELAQRHCAAYPAVQIINSTFEDWPLTSEKFPAVLAANAWHWVPPEVRCVKAAAALQPHGALILLWNMTPQLPDEIHQALQGVYQALAPAIAPLPEDHATQERLLQGLTQDVEESGLFQPIAADQIRCEVPYSTDDYLLLLNTFSPYRQLASQSRAALFTALRQVLDNLGISALPLTYLSAFQVASKR
jgi:SAM-dependent methyltransferase